MGNSLNIIIEPTCTNQNLKTIACHLKKATNKIKVVFRLCYGGEGVQPAGMEIVLHSSFPRCVYHTA